MKNNLLSQKNELGAMACVYTASWGRRISWNQEFKVSLGNTWESPSQKQSMISGSKSILNSPLLSQYNLRKRGLYETSMRAD